MTQLPCVVRQTTRVTLVQLSGDGRSPADDLEAVRAAVREHRGSDLVVFPEFALRQSVDLDGLASLAREGPAVLLGEIRERSGRLENLATYLDLHGAESYAKTHVHWTETFSPGRKLRVVPTPLGPTGLLICYDAAFSEVPRALTLAGAKAIVNLSAIPAHFPLKFVHRRLVASSVFNQVFTIFVNRTGEGYLGGSAVVDPQGEMIAVADERQPSLTVDIDMSLVEAWRTAEPILPNRKPAIYRSLAATQAPTSAPPRRVVARRPLA